MNYELLQRDIVVATDKKWLKRHHYYTTAIKLYGVLAKSPPDLSDTAMAYLCTMGLTTYQEAKRQLVHSGLLEVHKINSTTIVFVLGDKAIRYYARRIASKEHQRVLRKALESINYPDAPVSIEEDEVTLDYSETDLVALAQTIPKPIAIDTNIAVL